jgi:hypothetical protein
MRTLRFGLDPISQAGTRFPPVSSALALRHVDAAHAARSRPVRLWRTPARGRGDAANACRHEDAGTERPRESAPWPFASMGPWDVFTSGRRRSAAGPRLSAGGRRRRGLDLRYWRRSREQHALAALGAGVFRPRQLIGAAQIGPALGARATNHDVLRHLGCRDCRAQAARLRPRQLPMSWPVSGFLVQTRGFLPLTSNW